MIDIIYLHSCIYNKYPYKIPYYIRTSYNIDFEHYSFLGFDFSREIQGFALGRKLTNGNQEFFTFSITFIDDSCSHPCAHDFR